MNKPPSSGERPSLTGTLHSRWLELCERLGLAGDMETAGLALFARYEQPKRCYHNLQHIADCLRVLDEHDREATDPDAVEAAIWFHDAVYEIGTEDNELESAQLASEMLTSLGLASERGEHIATLIRTTDHRDTGLEHDAELLCDIDLSILGQSEERYVEYTAAILRETGLSTSEFAAPRHAFLESMLARESIFHTERFRQQYEPQARINMRRELERWARQLEE